MKFLALLFLMVICAASAFAQPAPKPYGPLPTRAQLTWHETEMYCIIHFGPDTYTDKEWGFGDEDPNLVNPKEFSAMQIVGAAKAGGFKSVVVVAKHHDGFCLWPTKTTPHNIAHSPYKNGKGDILREYQQACKKLGMKMGIYCSPWDRNSAQYGKPAYVTQVFRAQLTELYTQYGPLFIGWYDGANGGDGYYGGARELRKIDRSNYYGWQATWAIAGKYQPNAVLFGDVGPGVRWVGNERGQAGETCWATYTPHAPDEGRQPGNGYTKDYEGTEGHRDGKYWMPAECDVSLRPGWFYHKRQDDSVKTPAALLDLYYKSVGRGADLDLGLSPDRRGLLNDNDVSSLKRFGAILKQTFAVNLAKGAAIKASNVRGSSLAKFGPAHLLDNDRYTYWATDDKITTPTLTLNLHQSKTFNVIRLRENIKLGQRIDAVAVDVFRNGQWEQIAVATSIGSNRLIRLPQSVNASKVRLRITKAAACVALSDFGLYLEPGADAGVEAQLFDPRDKPLLVSRQFAFTEGPATDPHGNVFFTDQPDNKIWKYSTGGKLSVFMSPAGHSNGMTFDHKGNLIACADEDNELWSISPSGKVTVLVKDLEGKLLNGPNDVWVRPDGGMYFTDPYFQRDWWTRKHTELDGQKVYYLPPGSNQAVVADPDFKLPNGIVGTPDGKTLYVSDLGAGKTYKYTINPDGSLTNRKLFFAQGSDGMTLDEKGNLYLSGKGITIINPKGEKIAHIDINEPWTANVCFGGKNRNVLFITASTAVYVMQMKVKGVE